MFACMPLVNVRVYVHVMHALNSKRLFSLHACPHIPREETFQHECNVSQIFLRSAQIHPSLQACSST